jgi:Flp pilus assembly pilin Flp
MSRESGAAAIEYVMLLGFITALVLFFFGLLYPSGAEDFESLINAWGDKLATQIAGEPIDKSTEDAWGID